MNYTPIFLIGAARSGTKILRDTISTHPDIERIGYDINFIWKRYNENIEHDELESKHFKPKFKKFIDKYFESNRCGCYRTETSKERGMFQITSWTGTWDL